jgi:DNA-directed RNA polymerase specialized sigma24 family protein
MAKKKVSVHYVDNKKFLEALKAYKEVVNDAEASGDDRPRVPEYVGECFLLIAQRLSYRPNFMNYTFKDDMISDGIENCLAYIDNFNPEKSNNPFAYFTQIIYYAYLRRIQKEKRQTYIKYKATEKANIFGELAEHADDIEEIHYISNGHMEEFIGEYEETKRKKNEKRKQRGIEKLLAEQEIAEQEAEDLKNSEED